MSKNEKRGPGRQPSFNEPTAAFPTTIPQTTIARMVALQAHRTLAAGKRVNMNIVVNDVLTKALDAHDKALAKAQAKATAKSAPAPATETAS
jgi:hypothetical protein